ncbi:hypothetical protein KR009_002992 [Drosophila setifemur]|nr:hypothetical protein KR009_002992 [Drosophila setifemur]
MADNVLFDYLLQLQAEEEQRVLESATDSERKLIREIYEIINVTEEDLRRPFSQEDVRNLCLRTNVRVNMNHVNCLWDAKMRFDKKGRLDNRSEAYANAMYVKAVRRQMVEPYTDEEVSQYSYIARCNAKKANNLRLDRWRRQREKELRAAESAESPPAPLEMPTPPLAPQELLPVSETPVMATSEENEPFVPSSSENNLWGIGESEEQETQGPALDWEAAARQVNSQSLLFDYTSESLPDTQLTEPDYETFQTHVLASSTEEQRV